MVCVTAAGVVRLGLSQPPREVLALPHAQARSDWRGDDGAPVRFAVDAIPRGSAASGSPCTTKQVSDGHGARQPAQELVGVLLRRAMPGPGHRSPPRGPVAGAEYIVQRPAPRRRRRRPVSQSQHDLGHDASVAWVIEAVTQFGDLERLGQRRGR